MKNLGQNLGHNTMDRHAHRYAFCEHEGRPHITAREEKTGKWNKNKNIFKREGREEMENSMRMSP